MDDSPGSEAFTLWFLTLYGAAMLAVQHLEHSVSFLYTVVNTNPGKRSNATAQRQWRNAYQRLWRSFQQGSSGMRLNDAQRGIKAHLSADLYDDLDKFISGPRNQLAHRYLIERVSFIEHEGRAYLMAAAGELIEVVQQANRLRERIDARNAEIRASWPEQTEPPEDVKKFIEDVVRITTLKQFPEEVLDRARSAQHDRRARRDAR
jgi:hypothetical protein